MLEWDFSFLSINSYLHVMEVVIRKAESGDASAIMTLVHELAAYEHAAHEVTVDFDHFMESGFGPDPVWQAFVACQGEIIIGLALYFVRYSTWKGQRMYLEDLVVNPAHRGKGIGSLLMDSLIQEAENRQFSGINWQVLDWNESAINFYRKYKPTFDNGWINVSLDIPIP